MRRPTLRRLDVLSKRAVRKAMGQWRTWACLAALQFTRLASSLPADRDQQDKALYSYALAAVVLLAVVIHMEG